MLRRVDNPPNPYVAAHREWLDEPPPAIELEVYEEHAASILSENDSPDIPFRWSLNPYRGCQHGCAYCYARPTHEYLGFGAGSDFDSRICVKLNAPELLRRALAKRSWRGEELAFSGVTDCYQPLEAVYRLTQACLGVCLEMRNPVSIVTKSYLVLRDVELLRELDRAAGVSVYASIAFADDKLARAIEHGAPPPHRRFEALRRLRAAGLKVGVLVAPVIPGLNDAEIPGVLRRAADAGATSAACMPLRLPGNVAEVFLSRLREALPKRAARVEARVREMRGGALNDPRFGCRMQGKGEYWASVERLFRVEARRCGLRIHGGRRDCNTSPRAGAKSAPRVAEQDIPRGSRQLPLFGA